jgi:hypothetical protein
VHLRGILLAKTSQCLCLLLLLLFVLFSSGIYSCPAAASELSSSVGNRDANRGAGARHGILQKVNKSWSSDSFMRAKGQARRSRKRRTSCRPRITTGPPTGVGNSPHDPGCLSRVQQSMSYYSITVMVGYKSLCMLLFVTPHSSVTGSGARPGLVLGAACPTLCRIAQGRGYSSTNLQSAA